MIPLNLYFFGDGGSVGKAVVYKPQGWWFEAQFPPIPDHM